ncbi:MAG: hypothetical protein VW239_00325 [Candidatus Nanopelagicales bacterium]
MTLALERIEELRAMVHAGIDPDPPFRAHGQDVSMLRMPTADLLAILNAARALARLEAWRAAQPKGVNRWLELEATFAGWWAKAADVDEYGNTERTKYAERPALVEAIHAVVDAAEKKPYDK